MYQKLSESSGNMLGYILSERVTRSNLTDLERDIEAAIDEWNTVRLLLELDNLQGVQPCAVVEELKLNMKRGRDVERLAVVGECNREKRYMNPDRDIRLANTQLRFFERAEAEKAWTWIRE